MRNLVLLSARWVALLGLAILNLVGNALAGDGAIRNTELDRVSYAVDGVESSHGKNGSMWRANPEGPQGPMQVSHKAALDVGGGDRFDIAENRAMGRTYLAVLYQRYGNWPDAISAYNWGMGNLDAWIRGGRHSEALVPAVAMYVHRVLHESRICNPARIGLNECQLLAAFRYKLFDPNTHRAMSNTEVYERYPSYELYTAGMEHAGRVLPTLAASGRPLPVLAESGRAVPSFEQSGRPLRRNTWASVVCHGVREAGARRMSSAVNPYSVFAAACH